MAELTRPPHAAPARPPARPLSATPLDGQPLPRYTSHLLGVSSRPCTFSTGPVFYTARMVPPTVDARGFRGVRVPPPIRWPLHRRRRRRRRRTYILSRRIVFRSYACFSTRRRTRTDRNRSRTSLWTGARARAREKTTAPEPIQQIGLSSRKWTGVKIAKSRVMREKPKYEVWGC